MEISAAQAMPLVISRHYLHRRCNFWRGFGIINEHGLVGVCVFGIPAAPDVARGVSPADSSLVVELVRLWVRDEEPRNTESWFVRQCLAALPPRIVISYADTAAGHQGIIYRAAGFRYAGWTDMDRVTPRFDYVPAARTAETLFGPVETRAHSRDAFRSGARAEGVTTVRRKPKVRYWEVTGNRRERRELARICAWPSLSWKDQPPPGEQLAALSNGTVHE